jgi:predicted transcriptional regulator YdeE
MWVAMHVTIRECPSLLVLGFTIRTSNADAMSAIPPFWARARSARLPDTVPNAAPGGVLVAAYTEYERDHRGAYTMWIGVPITRVPDRIPDDMRTLEVPTGRYAIFEAKGDPQIAVPKTWAHIWDTWPDRAQRRFDVDIELHDPGRGVIEIRVGV